MSDAVTTIPLPRLRRTLLLVAGLNLAYFGVEAAVALAIGSVALLADSVDFLEDTAVNLLIVLALGWSLRARSRAGKALALVILLPAVAAAWQIVAKVGNPEPPQPVPLMITAGGAVVVNAVAALILLRVRRHGGSLTHGAWLAARNDVAVNLAIIAMGLLTAATAMTATVAIEGRSAPTPPSAPPVNRAPAAPRRRRIAG